MTPAKTDKPDSDGRVVRIEKPPPPRKVAVGAE
jgi:hypothetical protein